MHNHFMETDNSFSKANINRCILLKRIILNSICMRRMYGGILLKKVKLKLRGICERFIKTDNR